MALTRIWAISAPDAISDPTYSDGLRRAVAAAIDFSLLALERGEERAPAFPVALLAQARVAAHSGVGLDIVLRRYNAVYALLNDFLLAEAEEGGVPDGIPLRQLLRSHAVLFDRLLATVSEEYACESERRLRSTERRRAERVRRLLAGELIDTAEFAYDFESSHLGGIAAGAGAAKAFRDLSRSLDRRLLLVQHDEETVWAWLGGRDPIDPTELERIVSSGWPSQVTLAVGEAGQGLTGWRLTHEQAEAVLPIAARSSETLIRYADVAMLASILQDDLLAVSLRQLYLAPLSEERDGGKAARDTLRAYFACGCNLSSAAAALGVNRNTVSNRLRAIEAKIGRSLCSCAAELELALRLGEFDEKASARLPSATC